MSPQVRIADLGSAFKLRDKKGTSDFIIGTPGYMAPELLSGKRYGFSIDIWSLGSLMIALLAGTLPFSSEDRSERNRRVIEEPL